MNILNFVKKKYIRLQGSRNILKLNYFIEKNFRDEKLGNIGFDFSNKPTRQHIVQNIINLMTINKNNQISKNIWNWYQTHNLLKSTNKISNFF